MQMSGMCQQVFAIINRLVAERQGLVWNIFETDHPDIPEPPPNDLCILIRFHPPNHPYVYDLIVKPPLPSFAGARHSGVHRTEHPVSIIDWISKRSIRQMFATYFTARAQQTTHRDALWAVVRSRYPNAPEMATTFWQRHWRLQAEHPVMVMPDENQEEAELKTLIYSLLVAIGGSEPPGVDYVKQIGDIYCGEIKTH